jgi:hypothetical protein
MPRPNGGVGIYRPLDMPAIDAMTMSRVHPLRALDHAGSISTISRVE